MRILSLILALVMTLSLAACGSSAPAATEAPAAEASETFKVAIIQQLDHSSLDEIRNAIEAQLNTLAAEKGIAIEISYDNGQTWSQAKPTKITTSNAPGSFTRMPDGRIFLTWNNVMGHPMQAVRYSFARQCLHGAISDDNLRTLQGARILLKKTPEDTNILHNAYPCTTMTNEKEIYLRTFEVEGKGGSHWHIEQSYLSKVNPDFLTETEVCGNWAEWVCDIPVTENGVTLRPTTDHAAYAITSFPYGTAGKIVLRTEGTLPETCRILVSDCYLDRLNFMKNSRPNTYDSSIDTLYHTLTPTETGTWEIVWEDGAITLSVNGIPVQTIPMTASAGLNHAAVLFTDAGELRITHFEAKAEENRWYTGIVY